MVKISEDWSKLEEHRQSCRVRDKLEASDHEETPEFLNICNFKVQRAI